jgi:two-component system sensor histidine kinase VicK
MSEGPPFAPDSTPAAHWTLMHQLAAVTGLMLLLALGGLGAYTASEQSAIAGHARESMVASLARNMGVASVNLILTDSLDGMEELSLRSADFEDITSLLVLNPKGQALSHVVKLPGQKQKVVIDSPGTSWAVPTEPKACTHWSSDGDTIEAWQPVVAGKLIAWVRVEHNAASLQELRQHIWRNTFVAAVVAVFLGTGLLVLILRRPTRALDRARLFAVELLDANGRQIPIDPGPKEIVELNESLNEASMLLRQQMNVIEHSVSVLRTREGQLASQNDQLNAIFAMTPDGLLTFDQQGVVQFANQSFMMLTGLRADQVIGQSDQALDAMLQSLAAPTSTMTRLDDCFHPNAAQSEQQTLVIAAPVRRVLRLSGQISDSGTVSKVLYLCDVTRQHQLDQMKSEFLSMAAHELRTPMATIFGFTELLLARDDLDGDKQQQVLARIYRQSQLMISIINELLDLARIEARRGQDFELETMDLSVLMQAALADFAVPDERQAPLVVPPEGPMPVLIDRLKMSQAVRNVLSNAYKYSPQGGPVSVRHVKAQISPGRTEVGLAISDAGIGLSPEHLARMGERFFRADGSGNIPGTGLGVSIVKELLGLMRGHLEVQSELGRGTTVTLWLESSPSAAPAVAAQVPDLDVITLT